MIGVVHDFGCVWNRSTHKLILPISFLERSGKKGLKEKRRETWEVTPTPIEVWTGESKHLPQLVVG